MIPTLDQAYMAQRLPEYRTWVALCLSYGVQSYVELGTGSAHVLAAAGVPCVVAVDINNAGFRHNNHEGPGVSYIQGDSHSLEALAAVLDLLGGLPDAVFIDADHDGNAPRRDFELWWPKARLLCGFHDVQIPNVRTLWDEIALDIPSVEIIARDLASARAWQGPGAPADGILSGGGIGVLFKPEAVR